MLTTVPDTNSPSYEGLGKALSGDLAPLIQSSSAFMQNLQSYVSTQDGLDAPGGNADIFSGAMPGSNGASGIDQVARSMHLTDYVLQLMTAMIEPSGSYWTNPFASLMSLGNTMIITALTALGAAGLLSSTTGTAGMAVFNLLSGNPGAAAATVVAHNFASFLATPIMMGCMSLLIPGLTIAFVLPMIPWVMWIAGVGGWLILVCEAVLAVPLWMLAHMTTQGEGLHGRAQEGYSLLFNVMFRPTLMLFGLFMGLLHLQLPVLACPPDIRRRGRVRARSRMACDQPPGRGRPASHLRDDPHRYRPAEFSDDFPDPGSATSPDRLFGWKPSGHGSI